MSFAGRDRRLRRRLRGSISESSSGLHGRYDVRQLCGKRARLGTHPLQPAWFCASAFAALRQKILQGPLCHLRTDASRWINNSTFDNPFESGAQRGFRHRPAFAEFTDRYPTDGECGHVGAAHIVDRSLNIQLVLQQQGKMIFGQIEVGRRAAVGQDLMPQVFGFAVAVFSPFGRLPARSSKKEGSACGSGQRSGQRKYRVWDNESGIERKHSPDFAITTTPVGGSDANRSTDVQIMSYFGTYLPRSDIGKGEAPKGERLS